MTIEADDEHDFLKRLAGWRYKNGCKHYGRTLPAIVTMIPGMPLLALDQEKMPLRQKHF